MHLSSGFDHSLLYSSFKRSSLYSQLCQDSVKGNSFMVKMQEMMGEGGRNV